ncbi:MAG: Intein-containing protein [Candidatus Daviesbacteria bacterium GW2011_GWA2_42_7]|uniref:Intein-containing protein n=2 Tax=Candidatus Daviesiibacteriota TaxID=1752718 RepID=A0A0G1AWM5_9BACT|nr:MAG: Intein-containing protein [Candidatus Daviesbacteria bacterium GW2011_GWA1_42_6]KKS71059.1 MAG: Intein-containing protein [Candidatus Daviesbacteria bacterium GW2011_GWA2_42_7]
MWTAEFAYAVGLIATDGCLSKDGRHLDFTSKDLDQVKNFLHAVGITSKIGSKSSGYSQKRYYFVQFSNVKLYRFLLSIGLTSAKSKTIGELKIPSRFFADFLRGCLDGDGYTYSYFDPRWKSSFQLYTSFTSASKKHLEWLSDQVEQLYRIKGKIRFRANVFTLEYAKKSSVLLLNKLYYNADILCLGRKHSKIMNALGIISRQKAGMLKW